MQTYDLLMLAVLGGLTLYGYFKGMAWQIAYIASFVASYFLATRFADQIAPNITFVNPPANKFAAMFIIYVISSFFVWMIFRVVRKMIDSVKMEGFDHQMGAIIGFVRGVIWCVGLTFFAVTLLPEAQKQLIISSRSGYYIAKLLDETDSLFPPEVHQVVGPYLDRLNNELRPNGSLPMAPNQLPGNQPAGNQPNWATGAAGTSIQNTIQNTVQNGLGQNGWGQNNAQQNSNTNNNWGQPAQQQPANNQQTNNSSWPSWPNSNPPANQQAGNVPNPSWPSNAPQQPFSSQPTSNQPPASTPANPASWAPWP